MSLQISSVSRVPSKSHWHSVCWNKMWEWSYKWVHIRKSHWHSVCWNKMWEWSYKWVHIRKSHWHSVCWNKMWEWSYKWVNIRKSHWHSVCWNKMWEWSYKWVHTRYTIRVKNFISVLSSIDYKNVHCIHRSLAEFYRWIKTQLLSWDLVWLLQYEHSALIP